MKIAIVHEWFIDWAGSERVVEQILTCFPDADLFALVDFLPDDQRHKLFGKRATTTGLQNKPFARSHLKYYLPWMPIAIEQLDLSSYDVVISSSHAVAKGVITSPNQLHISYVHSPMRYAWDLQHDYLRGDIGRGLRGLALRWTLHYLRQWDLRTANSVDQFIANSHFVARRINKFYRRDAMVIHPPVNIDAFPLYEPKEEFYLCAGRLEPYKRIDIAVEAFSQMPTKRLIIMGDGPEFRFLSKKAPGNIQFIGHQKPTEWRHYLQRAKALIFPGLEDFGITPVEAQACGTSVIAYGKGGALETITPLGQPQPTGMLFYTQTAQALMDAVTRNDEMRGVFDANACRNNAERFSIAAFRGNFLTTVNNCVEKWLRQSST